uniref:Uncharacterized protein n=1 Tax=Romanomermis culicivorax TaxID=13658 RepID=A0A915JM87_ROMCU
MIRKNEIRNPDANYQDVIGEGLISGHWPATTFSVSNSKTHARVNIHAGSLGEAIFPYAYSGNTRPIHTHPITLYTLKDSGLSEEDQQDGVSRTACLGITLKH